MQTYLAKVLNYTIFIFIIVFFLAFAYTLVKGGIVPPSNDYKYVKTNDFDSPLLYFSPNDSVRAYEHTVLFDDNLVKDSLGCLQVDYTTSKKKNIGVKTTAYETRDLTYISFMARADKPMELAVAIGCASKPEIFFVRNVNISTKWDSYKINIGDFRPVDFSGKGNVDSLQKEDFAPYIEFAAPRSDIQKTGTFWIDKMALGISSNNR